MVLGWSACAAVTPEAPLHPEPEIITSKESTRPLFRGFTLFPSQEMVASTPEPLRGEDEPVQLSPGAVNAALASYVDRCGALMDGSPCVAMSPADPRPGDIVVIEVVAPFAEGVGLTAFNKEIPLFPLADRFRGVMGVPLHMAPADHPITVRTMTSDGTSDEFRCAPAMVQGREFKSDKLRVARRFARRAGHDRSMSEDDEVSTLVTPLTLPLLATTPFIWPKVGGINASFGERRVFNGRLSTRHLGIDLQGTVGQRVFATQEGIVRMSLRNRASGETIVIDHGGGLMSHYLHLSKRMKAVGQRVRQGEIIGLVGRTGRVTGPHLHFAMSVHGRYVDPEQVLSHELAPQESFGRCEAKALTTSAR